MVLGYALESQYELTIELVETQRELRPAAALALGQASEASQELLFKQENALSDTEIASAHVIYVLGGIAHRSAIQGNPSTAIMLSYPRTVQLLQRLLLTSINRGGNL